MDQATANKVVKEIHDSFSSAEQELLEEANAILEKASDEEKVSRSRELAKMGFGSAKPVVELSRESIMEAEHLGFLKQRYERLAPMYKFITYEKLIEICDKYKIIVGPSTRYNGDIPEKNQEDILSFKIEDTSFLEAFDEEIQDFTWETAHHTEVKPKEMSISHIINTVKMIARNPRRWNRGTSDGVKAIRAFIYELHTRGERAEIEHLKRYYEKEQGRINDQSNIDALFSTDGMTHFYVAADVGSFDQSGMTIEGVELKSEQKSSDLADAMQREWFAYYDPIVLAKVDGGYLIVTAWGAEASDPDVHNEKLN